MVTSGSQPTADPSPEVAGRVGLSWGSGPADAPPTGVCGAQILRGTRAVARDLWFLVSAVLIILAAVSVIALYTAH